MIIGAGCVGLCAAIGLSNQGYSVTIIDAQSGVKELSEPELRVSAISAASENILMNLGAWQHMDMSRISPYQHMKVWEKDGFGKIEFNATDINQSRLGHIIENNNIRNGLINVAQQQSNITILFEHAVQTIHNSPEQIVLTLDNNQPVIGKLLVAADGANSWVRQQLNTPIIFSDYDHHALVATINTTEPHNNAATQVFLPTGPVALLPLANPNQCSLVWSASPEKIKQLQQCSVEDFNKSLTAAFDSQFGIVSLVSDRPAYPLVMRYAQMWRQDRVVYMGDAAHTIHPLAGLGMNLGLLDAASLLQVMEREDALQEPQLSLALTEYEGWRKSEAQQYIAAMGGLKSLFSGNNVIKKIIRGIGLSAVNQLSPLKDNIIKHAMGLEGNIPEAAKKQDVI